MSVYNFNQCNMNFKLKTPKSQSSSLILCNFRNMRVLKDLTTEEILRWVEWKDVDMQYDPF